MGDGPEGYLDFPISMKFGFNLILLGIVLGAVPKKHSNPTGHAMQTDRTRYRPGRVISSYLLGRKQRCILDK